MSLPTHIALYRKYRPQSFSDVVGQEQIVSLLESTIKQKKISHAYLFCGGRGTGKTTVARIFARDIGCNEEDIIEIDAASNRGIEEIRELRDAVRTAPFSSPYKVYIMDEAHMLTKEAANALLKTLEEPPAHVVFILATTDPEKLPNTIVSRCQKIIFKSPDIEILSKQLIYVANKEGCELNQDSAKLIASHGNGSYRDALGILDQMLATSGGNITYNNVLTFLGITNKESLTLIIKSISSKDLVTLEKVLLDLERSTISPIRAYDDLVETIRLGLLFRMGQKEDNFELSSVVKEYPKVFSSKIILKLLSNRELIEVQAVSSWTAFQAIIIGLMEEL